MSEKSGKLPQYTFTALITCHLIWCDVINVVLSCPKLSCVLRTAAYTTFIVDIALSFTLIFLFWSPSFRTIHEARLKLDSFQNMRGSEVRPALANVCENNWSFSSTRGVVYRLVSPFFSCSALIMLSAACSPEKPLPIFSNSVACFAPKVALQPSDVYVRSKQAQFYGVLFLSSMPG